MENIALEWWIPYKLIGQENQLLCYWLNTYGQAFTEPFFEETILKCRVKDRKQIAHPAVSDPEMMMEWAKNLKYIQPSAVIFHISRCGSTLVSQMLATSDENIVLAEVPVFDDILRLSFKEPAVDDATIGNLLIAALKFHERGAYTGSLNEKQEKRVFIKTDSWHLFYYKQLRQLFPSVPFILMYRTPDEVFRSHRKQPGMQSVKGLIEPEIFGINALNMEDMSPDIYLASVLENYLSRYNEIVAKDKLCLLVNYNEGPMAILQKIAAFSKIQISKKDWQYMHDRSLYHSKKPNEPFNEEQVKNTPSCLAKAMELYRKLEGKRLC
ncbi:sulfotransferase [Mucilaginibacter gotjawali]|uniref:Uncharacterized protein n=2 Tax=Mucilaginibacter gotjawali TaxID=1550579 RepID=A0A0X8X4G4_9SPHI|nr:sulfotransferase [Mucilaginibacter gotjawali]MBB3056243.1 hypothetical protein [Mucilaginibacter gotjawali]BAU54947.1 hypothetical protein MgSA37_03127 [Mucilaginibacter gotjawali]